MGMFDYVRVDVPMPDGTIDTDVRYQSKDGECDMGLIVISAEGRLLFEYAHWEHVPKEERPYPDDEGLKGLQGSLKRVVLRVADQEFHGDFQFYGGGNEPTDLQYYVARFTEGQLVWIRRYEDAYPSRHV